MTYFVCYHDTYADGGGLGCAAFADRRGALEFIQSRMNITSSDLDAYTLIEGRQLKLEAVTVATKVEVE